MSFQKRSLTFILGACFASATGIQSQETTSKPVVPPEGLAPIAEASDEAAKALQTFQLPEGVVGSVWAAEPLLANPVAFHVMNDGSVLVAETFRHRLGVEDNRGHMYWLDDDIAAATTEDRLAMYQKWADAGKLPMNWYTDYQDRISWLRDTDADGQADASTVFATFNEPLDGIGSGVIERNGTIYYTNIPHLWKLQDTDHDFVAEVKEPMFSGFGVKVSLSGHDMHGLKWGPDGRLYWSIGDRSYSTESKEGNRYADAYSGAVFRCEPDGSNMEVFATGLRNPQELAFDDFGNLFSVDNDADGKDDTARVVYITEGSDTGWRMAYQYIGGVNADDDYGHGPWHAEGIWKQPWEGQPAYHVPPIGHVSEGPSGFTRYPGLGLPEKYKGAFFICDFRGGPGNSGVHSFHVKPNGAGYQVTESERFIWNVLPTDFDFDLQGGMMLADWVTGWLGEGKGRIYHMEHEASVKRDQAAIDQVAHYYKTGFENLCEEDLLKALAFPDQRVRLEAQYALEKEEAVDALTDVARDSEHLLARVHAIWALGNIGRRGGYDVAEMADLAQSDVAEIRVQILKALGNDGRPSFEPALRNALQDAHLQAQFHAAIGLGKIGSVESVPALESWIASWNLSTNDPFLRHAAVMAASGIYKNSAAGQESVSKFSMNGNKNVRLVELLALRRLKSEAIVKFLDDTEPFLVQEAARAIYDKPISCAYSALAELLDSSRAEIWNPMLYRRVIHANSRLGRQANLDRFVRAMGSDETPDFAKGLIFTALNDWESPDSKDAVMGMWRPIPQRQVEPMVQSVEPLISKLLLKGSDSIQNQAIEWAVKYEAKSPLAALQTIYDNNAAPEFNRARALKAISALESKENALKLAEAALDHPSSLIQAEAIQIFAKLNPESAMKWIQSNTQPLPTASQQAVVLSLGSISGDTADNLLLSQLEGLAQHGANNPAALEILQAADAKMRSAGREGFRSPLGQALRAYRNEAKDKGELGPFEVALNGGNASLGRNVFFNKIETQCVRCHQAGGEGASVVGPNLLGLGSRKSRLEILEAVALPNASIAEGFENVAVEMKNGDFLAGVLKKTTDTAYFLEVPKSTESAEAFGDFEDAFSEEEEPESDLAHGNGETPGAEVIETEIIELAKGDVASITRGPSGMPAGLANMLSLAELRDLMEYLATQ